MTREFYLIITGKKNYYGSSVNDFSIEIRSNKPKLNNDQIAVKLKMEVPKEFFERMIPVAELKLPKEAILTMSEATIISITAPEIAEKLKISLQDAEDGLKQMLSKNKKVDEENSGNS